MNVQNIQILFLLFDSIIKLASWRMVTETMERIGYTASESLARSLGVAVVVSAVFFAFPPISILGAILPAANPGGAMAAQVRTGCPLVSHMLLGSYLGLMVWGGLWLWKRNWRALMSPRSRFA
jgi:TRAP-type C4-dicarboxylate transport system permease small subunit